MEAPRRRNRRQNEWNDKILVPRSIPVAHEIAVAASLENRDRIAEWLNLGTEGWYSAFR